MNLQNKILYCRKKAGLSQEALATQLGVSRQAISKWETGDAVPEINKILLLAKAFGVTTDWLLSDDEPQVEATKSPVDEALLGSKSTWVDTIPGLVGSLLRRYGWLFGVYLAVVGAGFTGTGVLARYMVRRMFSDSFFGIADSDFSTDAVYFDQDGSQMDSPFSLLAANNPVSIMGTVIMVTGIVLMITGIILAVVLKKRSKE